MNARICSGAGQEPILVDGRWICPDCRIEVPPEHVRWSPSPPSGEDLLGELEYADYLKSPEWLRLMRAAVHAAGGRCQGCDSPDYLEVHHRTYVRRGREWLEDLTVFCAACHDAIHRVADGRRGVIRRRSRVSRALEG